jgi:hypothetical protein
VREEAPDPEPVEELAIVTADELVAEVGIGTYGMLTVGADVGGGGGGGGAVVAGGRGGGG